MFQQIKVAAISFTPRKFDLEGNANRLEEAFRSASEKNVQLAVGPEGVLEGYVVNEIISMKVPAEKIREVAVTVNGRMIKRFRALARELNICLAFGLAENIGGEIYNCAIFIDQQGKIRGKYHKMQFAEGYHPSWWFNRIGAKARSFTTPFGHSGFLICNDRWNPELARISVLDGAQYLIIPSFGSSSKAQDRAVLARARENGVAIVEANVGVTLIISKGEVVAVSRKKNTITTGIIEIPARPSRVARDAQEKRFLDWRKKEMKKRYQQKKSKV